jgi:RNA polymerase sigma-70 factor (ECF subfamily)
MPEKSRSERDWHVLLADQMTRHGRLFYKVAHGILRDAPAAEDACQQALLKALSRFDQIRSEDSLRAWLVKVVVTESLAVRRRRRLEERTRIERAPRPAAALDDGAHWERRDAVLEALETLPEPTRVIVVMRLLDGMNGGEVSHILGCSEAHVSRQLHGGMALLRIALQDWKTGSDGEPKG